MDVSSFNFRSFKSPISGRMATDPKAPEMELRGAKFNNGLALGRIAVARPESSKIIVIRRF